MTGFSIGVGRCFCRGAQLAFHPQRVPSIDDQPICASCMKLVNEQRAEAGLPVWPVYDDSYAPMPGTP
jgi:hypothetical protein